MGAVPVPAPARGSLRRPLPGVLPSADPRGRRWDRACCRDGRVGRRSHGRQEIRYGSFQRSIPLPVEVDAAKATAELKNGMLKVTLPKSKHPKAQEIKVAVG